LRFQTDGNDFDNESEPANPPQKLFRVTSGNGKVKYIIIYENEEVKTVSSFGYTTTGEFHLG